MKTMIGLLTLFISASSFAQVIAPVTWSEAEAQARILHEQYLRDNQIKSNEQVSRMGVSYIKTLRDIEVGAGDRYINFGNGNFHSTSEFQRFVGVQVKLKLRKKSKQIRVIPAGTMIKLNGKAKIRRTFKETIRSTGSICTGEYVAKNTTVQAESSNFAELTCIGTRYKECSIQDLRNALANEAEIVFVKEVIKE